MEKNKKVTWVLHGTVITQDEDRHIFPNTHLRIEDHIITDITSKLPDPIEKEAHVIDASNKVILPGWVQIHTHLCQTLFRNQADDLSLLEWLNEKIWKFEAAHTPETLRMSAELGVHELLASGTTCILDMATVQHTESILEVIQQSGLRAHVGKCLMDHPETTPSYLREPYQTGLKETERLFHQWNHSLQDQIRISLAPRFAISCTHDLFLETKQLADDLNTLIHTHASENKEEVSLIKKRTGLNNVEYLYSTGMLEHPSVLAHGIWLEENEKTQIQSSQHTSIAHCPSSNLKLASGIADIPDLLKKDLCIGLGTDGAACNNTLNMFEEMRQAALLQKPFYGAEVMKAQTVLDLATRNGAKALQWFDQIGSIEKGKNADFMALDLYKPHSFGWHPNDDQSLLSAIVYSASPENVEWTMVNGRVCYKKNPGPSLSGKWYENTHSALKKLYERTKEL